MSRYPKAIDHIMLTLLILSLIFTTHLVAFEMGKREQCNRDPEFRYSVDFSACIKIGKGGVR